MKIKMTPTNSDEIRFTLTATMTLAQWLEIKKEIEKSSRSPVYEFHLAITQALQLAQKEFEPPEEDNG